MSLELNNVLGMPKPVNTFYVSLPVPRVPRPRLSSGETGEESAVVLGSFNSCERTPASDFGWRSAFSAAIKTIHLEQGFSPRGPAIARFISRARKPHQPHSSPAGAADHSPGRKRGVSSRNREGHDFQSSQYRAPSINLVIPSPS